ncbi:sensor histidine kinase [Spirillospora sp. CA-294931]|uniref:sensor histidine kinase n=1 Tax=Spirillospora sp. CA-294931 TaxID=3240042 RepID=UPI003D9217E7
MTPTRAVRALSGSWTRARVMDVALATGAWTITLAMSAMTAGSDDKALWPFGAFLITLASLALMFRRRYPVSVLVVTMIVPPLYYPLGYPEGPVGLVFLIGLFTAAAQCRLWVTLHAAVAVNAGILVVSAVRGGHENIVEPEGTAALTVMMLGTIGLGQYVRSRRMRMEAAEHRAAEAERTREEEARRRATEERLRIARELHDILAHQISLINVQAGAALHRRDDPEQAYASLEAIKLASKTTLRELRGVLGVLRQVDTDETGGTPEAPTATLGRLTELLAHTTAAGITVQRTGDTTDQALADMLPAPVALAGYRIVQEALTNAVRHSGAAAARGVTVTVDVRRSGGALVVQIDDDGAGPSDPAALERGNGLRGMRERAAAVGGDLSAGRGPAGGFRVRAVLPVTGSQGHDRGRAEGLMEESA